MKKALISDLKNRLSHYLRFVRKGESVLVLDRDRVIARIDPVRSTAIHHTDDLDELIRAGAIRPPTAPLPKGWVDRRVRTSVDVVAALLDERAAGR